MTYFRRKHKYGADRTQSAGYSFASKLESAVHELLKLRQLAGEIASVEVQSRIRVCCPPPHEHCDSKCKVEYIPDFRCTRPDGSVFYAEAKGMQTTDYRIKRRLFLHHRSETLEFWGGSARKPVLIEVLNGPHPSRPGPP